MEYNTDTLVIGSGPGGYVAAIRAAQLGQQVTIVESNAIGGVCLNVGCIPSKALIHAGHVYQESKHSHYLGITNQQTTLDFQTLQKWKEETVVQKLTSGIRGLLLKNKVQIVKGYARFLSPNQIEIKGKGEKTFSSSRRSSPQEVVQSRFPALHSAAEFWTLPGHCL